MKITGVKTFLVDGGWDVWGFLRLTTDEGLIGWSEFSQARSRKGLHLLIEDMADLVLGADPRHPARVSAHLAAAMLAPPEGLRAMAIGAYENACLDIAGKALGVPVAQLLGGKLRDRLELYWSHCAMQRVRRPDLCERYGIARPVRTFKDVEALGAEVAAGGYRALKTNLLRLPGPADAAGVVQPGEDRFARNVTPEIVALAVDLMSAFRRGAGTEVGLMLDINFNFKVEGLRHLARALEPVNLTWLEIDCPDAEQLARVRLDTSVPIASMETLLGRRSLRPYLASGAVDVGIIDPVYNGVMESLRMAAMIEACEVNVAAHNSHGPLSGAIAAQFCAALSNFRIMEFDPDAVPWRYDLLDEPLEIERGRMTVPDRPGWGRDVNEAVALKFAA